MAAAFAANARGEARLAREYGDAALDAEHALAAPRPYTLDLSVIRYTLAGFVALSTGAWDDAAAAFLEGAARARRADRIAFVAASLGGAASALCYGGRFADAVPVATEGLAVARAIGVPSRHHHQPRRARPGALPPGTRTGPPPAGRGLPPGPRLRDLQRAGPDEPRRLHARRLAPHRTLRHPQHPPRRAGSTTGRFSRPSSPFRPAPSQTPTPKLQPRSKVPPTRSSRPAAPRPTRRARTQPPRHQPRPREVEPRTTPA